MRNQLPGDLPGDLPGSDFNPGERLTTLILGDAGMAMLFAELPIEAGLLTNERKVPRLAGEHAVQARAVTSTRRSPGSR